MVTLLASLLSWSSCDLMCRPRRKLKKQDFCVFLCRNGRFSELWGLWTLSAPKLVWVWQTSPSYCVHLLEARLTACLTHAGNHSCTSNAEASFPENNFLLHLCALSDINPGEVSWHVGVSALKCWPLVDGAERPSVASAFCLVTQN